MPESPFPPGWKNGGGQNSSADLSVGEKIGYPVFVGGLGLLLWFGPVLKQQNDWLPLLLGVALAVVTMFILQAKDQR